MGYIKTSGLSGTDDYQKELNVTRIRFRAKKMCPDKDIDGVSTAFINEQIGFNKIFYKTYYWLQNVAECNKILDKIAQAVCDEADEQKTKDQTGSTKKIKSTYKLYNTPQTGTSSIMPYILGIGLFGAGVWLIKKNKKAIKIKSKYKQRK